MLNQEEDTNLNPHFETAEELEQKQSYRIKLWRSIEWLRKQGFEENSPEIKAYRKEIFVNL